MTGDEPAIRTEGLTKRYGGLTAVDGLDLTVPRGEIFGLLGPNGAGKTTTILMLLGLTPPSAGGARVVGVDPVREPLEVKRHVGYLPDSVGFYGDMSGRQNLRYTARLNRMPEEKAESRTGEVLGEVGLEDRADDLVRTYSRGMIQRLGIADALVKDPDVLVLDEPTIAIDPEGAEEMLALIRRLPGERGVTVLLSSHLLQQVQSICDRVGIFVEGRLVADGSIDDLARRHGGRVVIEVGVADGDPSAALTEIAGVVDVRRNGDRWLAGALTDVRADIGRALGERGFVLTHLLLRREELSEIYRHYFVASADRQEEDEDGRDQDGEDGRATG